MKISVLNLLLGKAEIPEGFPVAFPARFVPNESGGPAEDKFYYSAQIDPDYYFLLERIGASYPYFNTGGAVNIPAIEVLRDKGTRPYQESAVPLRLVATPGETLSGGGATKQAAFVDKLKSAINPASFWEPGSVLKMTISGVGLDPSGETRPELELIAFGRYIFREDYRTKGGALK